MRLCRLSTVVGISLVAIWAPLSAQEFSAQGQKFMAATVHPIATEAALAAFDQGGNAVDAAIAAALTLGVVDGYNSGIGGGCFVLIRRADGTLHAIDGREQAPRGASRDMYLVDGKPNPKLSQDGPLAIAVPGALAAYEQAVREFGNLSFSKIISRAADVAGDGFEVTPALAGAISAEANLLREFRGNWGSILKPDGTVYSPGERMVQPDLAQTYRAIAEHGTEWFYRGPFAESCSQWFESNGGLVRSADFADYHTVVRDPIVIQYRGFDIAGFPPPSSGGVHVAQILSILENFDLAKLYREQPATFYHVVVEAMRLAFADRAYWLGDPDFASVPRGLIHPEYGRQLASQIDLHKANPEAQHGDPLRFDADFFRKHTTHIATADAEGNWVALTTTVNTTFGSKVVVPGTGVVLNDQMDDFASAPGVPNAFGLVGAEANAIAPGKRPLSSMSPTIVLKDGQPVLTLGAAGGPTIISQVVWGIVRCIDLQMGVADAVSMPRIHHQWSPDEILCERAFDPQIRQQLTDMGHSIRLTRNIAVGQAISFDRTDGRFIGVYDPRVSGKASGR